MLDKEKYEKEMEELKKEHPNVTILIEATEQEVDWLKQKTEKRKEE